jgi:hypothetical protein
MNGEGIHHFLDAIQFYCPNHFVEKYVIVGTTCLILMPHCRNYNQYHHFRI